MQKIDILKAIARNLDCLTADDVVASATGTSVDAAKLIHPSDGQLKGHDWYAYSGAGAGQQRTATDFDADNNRLIFGQVLGSIPSTNTNFVLLRKFKKDMFDNAIERAVGKARQIHLNEMTVTLSIVATQYTYPVPSGMEYMSSIRFVPSGNSAYDQYDETGIIFELRSPLWRIEQNVGGTYQIVIDPRRLNITGQNLGDKIVHLIGQAPPTSLGSDNTECDSHIEEFVINHATAKLASLKVSGQPVDDPWKAKFAIYRDEAKVSEGYILSQGHGVRVKS